MDNNLKVDVDMLMDIRDTKRLALTIMTIEPVLDTMEIDTLAKLNKILIKRFVAPVVNYKFFDCPNCLKNCTDAQKMQGCLGFLPKRLNQVLIVDEDKEELNNLLMDIADENAVISKRYEGTEKPFDPDIYMQIRRIAKALLAMNGKMDLYNAFLFGDKP